MLTFLDSLDYWINQDYLKGKAWIDYEKNHHTKYQVQMEGNVVKDGVNSVIVSHF